MKLIQLPIPGHPGASLEGYVLDCEISYGQETARPAVLVCPGGGYLYCSPREGEPVALRYAAQGFHAFLLRYSTGWDAGNFAPLEEVSWAIGCLRQHAGEWNLDPKKIAVCGFSAGGHLALASGILGENRPNAMILGYPAASAPNIPGADFMLKLLCGRKKVTDEDAARFDLVSQIGPDAPPMFLVATSEDLLTNYGALPIVRKYAALRKHCELHLFQYGPHGLSLADVTSCNGSSQVVDPAFAQWHGLSVLWLKRTFGEPKLVDKSVSPLAEHIRNMDFSPDAN